MQHMLKKNNSFSNSREAWSSEKWKKKKKNPSGIEEDLTCHGPEKHSFLWGVSHQTSLAKQTASWLPNAQGEEGFPEELGCFSVAICSGRWPWMDGGAMQPIQFV